MKEKIAWIWLTIGVLLFKVSPCDVWAQDSWHSSLHNQAKSILLCDLKGNIPFGKLPSATGVESVGNNKLILIHPYLGEPKVTTLNGKQESLLPVLVRTELETRLSEQVQKSLQRKDMASKPNNNFAQPFIYSDLALADAVLLARNNEVLIFPRMMLLHPLVQSAKILPGDFLVTFPLKRSSNTADPRNSYFEFATINKEEPVAPRLNVIIPSADTGDFEPKVLSDVWKRTEEGKRFPNLGDIPTSQPIVILTTTRGEMVTHFIAPFRSAGLLGEQGVLFKSLFVEFGTGQQASDNQELWENGVLAGFSEIRFRKTDILTFSTIESVPFFISGASQRLP